MKRSPMRRRCWTPASCLVTPGLINTHHHIYQNLTRAYRPATVASLFDWLTALYPRWSRLDEEAAYVSAWVGLAELALGGCTTSTDHLYVHPSGGGDLISAEIRAATELGVRFHPTRGSMSLSQKDGGLPPDSVVQDDDEILADSERLVSLHHDRERGAMVRIALAPCSPFSVTSELMVRTAELAERLDVRLHTHLAEDPDEDRFAAEKLGQRTIDHFESVGWMTDRSWVAHCIYPNDERGRAARARRGRHRALPELEHDDRRRRHRTRRGDAGRGITGRARLRRIVVDRLGVALDGGAQRDAARPPARWPRLDRRTRCARDRDPRAVRDASAAPARSASSRSARPATSSCGRSRATSRTRAHSAIPIEAWLRCGPSAAPNTVIAGEVVVRDGALVDDRVDEMLRVAPPRRRALPVDD